MCRLSIEIISVISIQIARKFFLLSLSEIWHYCVVV